MKKALLFLILFATTVLTALSVPTRALAEPDYHRAWPHPTPMNQHMIAGCVGAAWWGFMESAPSPYPVDWYYLYKQAQLNDPFPGEDSDLDGTTLRAGGEMLQRWNLVGSITYTESIEEMREWLFYRGPVVWAMVWPNTYVTPQGYLQFSEEPGGGHALLIYGVEGDTFLVMQSWGSEWGPKHNGLFKVKKLVMEQLMDGYGGIFALATKSFGAIGTLGHELKVPI